MRCLTPLAGLLLFFVLLLLTACGSGSGGTGPFTTTTSPSPSGGSPLIFGNISTTTGRTGIALKADRETVDVENGQVLVTATVVSDGAPLSGAPVTFSIAAPVNGPATVEAGRSTVTTDSNGVAVARITAGLTPITTSVIVQATTIVRNSTATATTTFQIVRGNGVIMFDPLAGIQPGQQKNQLAPETKEVDPAVTSNVAFLQQLPFKVTDSNGNPRVGVPVVLSVFSAIGASVSVAVDKSPMMTDSAGQAIFNASVALKAPPAGSFTSASVIFLAQTNDAPPVTAYVGGSYSLTAKLPSLTLSPGTASFGDTSVVSFAISGGVKPFSVSSSNPGRVSTTLLPDGTTVVAQLVDSTTQWTGNITVSVTDSAGQTASATVTR